MKVKRFDKMTEDVNPTLTVTINIPKSSIEKMKETGIPAELYERIYELYVEFALEINIGSEYDLFNRWISYEDNYVDVYDPNEYDE
jgi:hypothetical protein